ncbi:MAG: DUF624 domain-containing protein [Clostridiales bacterium]|nr:DUF624 domain-containing protein [Clostridiales bacterium]
MDLKIFGKEFKLFNYSLEGKGVKKEPEGPKNLKNFFKHFGSKFTRLVTVNMYYIFGNFPILFAILAMSGNLDRDSWAPAYKMFPTVYGIMQHTQSPAASALFGMYGTQSEIGFPTTLTYISWALAALVIFTFGLVNIGTTYIIRNMVKGEPIFMWEDFWYAIKRNLKQGMIMGILDVVFSVLIVYDITFFYFNAGVSGVMNFMFYASILLAAIWFWMRFYIYILMVTFDLSIFKILKNSLIFSIIGFKRNFMATLGIVAMVILTYTIMLLALPIGIIIPFVLLFADCSFMACYAAFPKIKEIMIDPYYTEPEPEEYEEPIFHDLG